MLKKTVITISLMLIVFFGIGVTVEFVREYKGLNYASDLLISLKELVNDKGVALEEQQGYCIEYTEVDKTKIARKIFYDKCSKNKPGYCDSGTFIDKCSICGCEDDEVCSSNGECVYQGNTASSNAGGGASSSDKKGGASAGVAASGGSSGGGSSGNDCYDSDISVSPNPIYESGNCADATANYGDACEDPISGAASSTWVKEYKCQKNGNTSSCTAVYKNCVSSSLVYFGDSNSVCGANKCSTPTMYIQQNTTINISCIDGILNQDETNIDCGGVCAGYFYNNSCHQTPQALSINATCSDEIRNQDETNIDCGGVCGGYWYSNSCHVSPQSSCSDEIQNQDETGVDCGGVCQTCQTSGGSGEQHSNNCYVAPLDEHGLSIFTASTCHDDISDYQNSCTSPVDGTSSGIFIKTYVCIDNKCVPKYYSCPVKAKEVLDLDGYQCLDSKCGP